MCVTFAGIEIYYKALPAKEALPRVVNWLWVSNVTDTFYVIGTVAGPHPYPMMVRDFQSVIGKETKQQIIKAESRLPDLLLACIGGGSNALGLFYPFLNETKVKIIGELKLLVKELIPISMPLRFQKVNLAFFTVITHIFCKIMTDKLQTHIQFQLD